MFQRSVFNLIFIFVLPQLSVQSRRFAKWEVELEQEEQYTDRYKDIARRVFDEYCQLMEVGFNETKFFSGLLNLLQTHLSFRFEAVVLFASEACMLHRRRGCCRKVEQAIFKLNQKTKLVAERLLNQMHAASSSRMLS